MKKHFISLSELTRDEFIEIFKLSMQLKNCPWGDDPKNPPLRGMTMGMIFEKPSTRTSISFAVGVYQLGGLPLILSAQDLQLNRGESITDTARVLSRYVDIIMIRAHKHKSLIDLASRADVPVINGLTDKEHPCQILSDLFTIIEKKIFPKYLSAKHTVTFNWKKLSYQDLKLTYVGDGNNIAHSWIHAASILGMKLTLSCPHGYEPDRDILQWGKEKSAETGAVIHIEHDPHKAVEDADIIYTDVWTSMGKEKEKENRRKSFEPYQVNEALVNCAKKDVIVMHCLPAHRGEEITDQVLDGSHSVVFDEAENRLHVQKAVIIKLLKRN